MLLGLEALEKRLNGLEPGGAEEPAGPPLDTATPEFELPDLTRERHTLTKYGGKRLLMLFFNPACGFGRELAPDRLYFVPK